jgi:hypothetical protein
MIPGFPGISFGTDMLALSSAVAAWGPCRNFPIVYLLFEKLVGLPYEKKSRNIIFSPSKYAVVCKTGQVVKCPLRQCQTEGSAFRSVLWTGHKNTYSRYNQI